MAAPLAQLVEQLTLNQLVEGSSPSWRSHSALSLSAISPDDINNYYMEYLPAGRQVGIPSPIIKYNVGGSRVPTTLL